MFIMNPAGLSDTGLVRTKNEDAYAIEPPLLIVADGMGGAAAGEVASSTAISIITNELKNISYLSDNELTNAVRQAIINADDEIKKQTKQDTKLIGMGTTVVLAIYCDNRLLIGNVGDSRAYLITNFYRTSPSPSDSTPLPSDATAQTAILQTIKISDSKETGSISRITEDHSLVMEMVRSGVIKEEDIRTHPMRNRITKCVGSLRDDFGDFTWLDIHDGDILIMCSDGLWELVHEDLIFAIVSSSKKPDEMCKRLIEAANNAGGFDNITVIAAEFKK
ncbi:PP2C family protein-serine/threonine phosphatase [Candidatus Latescibacterota bacterium]